MPTNRFYKCPFIGLTLLSVLAGSCAHRKSGDKTPQGLDTSNLTHQSNLILNWASLKCITDKQSDPTHPCSQRPEQKFSIKEVSPRLYNIISNMNGQCLTAPTDAYQVDLKVVFSECSPMHASQQIFFTQSKNDRLFTNIVFAQNSKCLAIANTTSDKIGGMQAQACEDLRTQDFLFLNAEGKKKVLPKIIWSYWDKGESQMPAFYKANVKHWRSLMHGWEIRVTNNIKGDPLYFGHFVSEGALPSVEFLQSKISPTEKKLTANVVFSDFVRMELLNEHGGVWMDPSIMLHRSLHELSDLLEISSDFSILGYTSYVQATKEYRDTDSFENFFIMTLPKTELLKEWRKDFHRYWQEKTPGLSIENHPMFNGTEGPKVDVMTYGDFRNYLNQHLSLKHVLTRNPGLQNQIFIVSGVRANEKGPFTLLDYIKSSDGSLLEMNTSQQERLLSTMRGVLMSKFPSETSKVIRAKIREEDYFFRKDNIFGILNSLSSKD